jgi:hypothetical protein
MSSGVPVYAQTVTNTGRTVGTTTCTTTQCTTTITASGGFKDQTTGLKGGGNIIMTLGPTPNTFTLNKCVGSPEFKAENNW